MRHNAPCKNSTEYWAPSQVYRETEGERLHDPDVWMIVASFVQPPRQGRGPASGSGGEGTAERMCGVWGDATVACCRAVVRRLCGLCRGVCGRYLCASRVRWTRFAPPAASKPSAVASKDEARSRPRYGTALCTASIVLIDRALSTLV